MEKATSENSSKLLKLLSQYKVYRERAKSFNPAEFIRARLKLRPAKEKSAQAKLKAAYGKNFDEATFYSGIRDTDTANADHFAAQPTDKPSAPQNTHKPHIKWQKACAAMTHAYSFLTNQPCNFSFLFFSNSCFLRIKSINIFTWNFFIQAIWVSFYKWQNKGTIIYWYYF